MRKTLQLLTFLLLIYTISYTQTVQPLSQLKTFQQSLNVANVQFSMPKDFKEIKALRTTHINVDFAMEIPNANFQVWYAVESLQQERAKFKAAEVDSKRLIHPDSLYNLAALSAATKLAGKDNFTSKNLPQETLDIFHADKGKSYQLNLYDRPETNHYQYGLLISLQKNGSGYISMLFLSNENGPEFYKKVNKAYYSVSFN
jgi:hypothetical protein